MDGWQFPLKVEMTLKMNRFEPSWFLGVINLAEQDTQNA